MAGMGRKRELCTGQRIIPLLIHIFIALFIHFQDKVLRPHTALALHHMGCIRLNGRQCEVVLAEPFGSFFHHLLQKWSLIKVSHAHFEFKVRNITWC